MPEQYSLTIRNRFNAARALRHYTGKCANIHGHDFCVEAQIGVPEPDDEQGMSVDFYDLKTLMQGIAEQLDHCYLNEIPPFDTINPTDENLAKWFYQQLCRKMPHPQATVMAVTLWENADFGVTIRHQP